MRTASSCKADGHTCWKRVLESPLPEVAPVTPSALPEAIDSLDTSWRLAFGKNRPLTKLRSATVVAGIVMPCSSRDDFKARLSDIDDIMKKFSVADDLMDEPKPPVNETFNRIRAALAGRLDDDDLARVDEALTTLRAVNRLRVGFQHSERADEIPTAYSKLGMSSPSEDWQAAWETVRSRTTGALRSLTEVVRELAI